jgi:alpha-mannosidase/mannosylglycerate hydrolase
MKTTAHYISGTHWDREWYRPFQEYRVLLVRLVDLLLDVMEKNKHFRYFQLDGQTCVLQDYLEVRPENRARLARLIKRGRILVGPWYTMPDLFCPDDESLIRNLLLGRRISREWGVGPMPVGFICDMFGHPSQVPQIFAGFDLHDVVLGRGTNEHTTPMLFHWESPDETRVLAFKLQDAEGYGAFNKARAVMERSLARLQNMRDFIAEMEAAGDDRHQQTAIREKYARQAIAHYVGHEQKRSPGALVCLMDSMDHIPPATDLDRYFRLIREACPDVEPLHSNLPAFFQDARRIAQTPPVKRGELREPSRDKCGYLWLIPNCVSSRIRLKQANDHAVNLLERWVEPLLAFANLTGAPPVPAKFLHIAWQHVLTNHAHDSICGCSIDQVHRDMMYRFDQARVLGQQLRHQALAALTADCADLARHQHEFTLTVVNPLPQPRNEVVVFNVDLPLDYPAEFKEGFRTQTLKAFTFEDADGNPVPYQRLRFVPLTIERSHVAQFDFQNDGAFTRYAVAAKLNLPALGFTSLRVKPSSTPVRSVGTLRTGPTAAENENLGIAIEADGTLTLTDKKNGQTYTHLLLFEDRSEIGDGWFHGHSLNDEQLLSAAGNAQVAVVHEGSELASFRSTVTLSVPARYDWKNERPARDRVPLVISSLVTLRRDARVVDVQTTVTNNAEDHRLRLLLPTDARHAQTYLAHTPFDIVERNIACAPQTADWQEMEIPEKPFQGLQAVGDGARGLVFLSGGGIHEGGVADDQRRTMHVTLLRSYRRTVGTGDETDGLELGQIEYRYALMPYAGSLPAASALHEMARLQTDVLTRQTGQRPSGYPPLTGCERPCRSFLKQESGTLVVSAVKPPESGHGIIIRLWNPTGEPQTDVLTFHEKPKRATAVKLSEDAVGGKSVTLKAGKLAITAKPHQIVSVKVEFD